MRANNLEEAIPIFDPQKAIKEEDLHNYFVERKYSPLTELKLYLKIYKKERKSSSILFTGHRGSGKSTELNKLASEIKNEFFIVHFSVDKALHISDLEYTDVLIAIGSELYKNAFQRGLRIDENIIEDILNWMRETIKEDIIGDTTETNFGAKLNLFFLKLGGKIQTETTTRTTVREKIQPRVAELIEKINILISKIELISGKDVLILIDDLDKPNLDLARKLFFEHSAELTKPQCKIVFTIPIALIYSNDMAQIKHSYDRIEILPNIKIHNQDNSPYKEGYETIKKIIENRMKINLIEKDALSLIIENSGGLPRDLIRIIQKSCVKSLANRKNKITKEVVEEVISEEKNDFRRVIKDKYYSKLKEIYETKELKNAEELLDLLHNLSILEYKNTESWCDVHPIVVSLMKEKGKLN